LIIYIYIYIYIYIERERERERERGVVVSFVDLNLVFCFLVLSGW